MRPRPSHFLKTVLLCCVFATAGRAQYVEDSVEVPGGWVGSMTYNSQADVVYGTCEMANSVFAIYCPNNIMFRDLPANDARCVVYDPIDNKAYVSCGWEGAESLKVIDGQNHIIVGRFSVPGANQLVWEPTRNRLYATCSSEGCVAVVDCAGDSVIEQIAVGAGPIVLHLNTRRGKLYVQNYDDASVSIVDLATNQVIKTIQVSGYPNAGYYASHVDKYYCASDPGDETIVVIDGLTDSIIARVPIMDGVVHAVGGNDATDLVLAEAYNGPTVLYAMDARADTLLSTIDVSGSVWSIVCGPTTGFLYCASTGADSVLVVDPVSALVVNTLAVGDAPFVSLPVPLHGRMYVGHINASKVYVIRDSSTGVTENGVGARPRLAGLVASPNPFSTITSLALASLAPPTSSVVIYGLDGKEVRRIGSGSNSQAAAVLLWDGTDARGNRVPAGIYVAAVACRPESRTKIVKLR
jgi:YVTN family beta-propeller protein